MPEISCILCTARDDYSIIGLPNLHIFKPTLSSLAKQTFTDFELIIVDALYGQRRGMHDFSNLPFSVKHIPPDPRHSFWLKKGLWNVCGMLNTAILHAEGDLIVRLDDCCEFEEWYLQRFWEEYQSGWFPMAMHIRYNSGEPARVTKEYFEEGYEAKYAQMPTEDRGTLLKRIYGENGIVRDTRWPTVEKHGRMKAPPEWFYGYSSFSLEAALKVNGFNELFDGTKGQEDQDLGVRLALAGYRDTFLLDRNLWVIEHEHLPAMVESPQAFKCNLGLILWEKTRGLYIANEHRLTTEDCEKIRTKICPSCLNFRRCQGERLGGKFYVEDDPLFKEWLENQNNFNLREERLGV